MPKRFSSLPDKPLAKDVVVSLERTSGIDQVVPIRMKDPQEGNEGPDKPYTNDVIIIREDRVHYLSRIPGEGWLIERSESYTTFEEFKAVVDDVSRYAEDYSEQKVRGRADGTAGI